MEDEFKKERVAQLCLGFIGRKNEKIWQGWEGRKEEKIIIEA